MSPLDITVAVEELNTVARLAAAVPPVETDGEGIWIHHHGNQRYWSVEGAWVGWALDGDSHDDWTGSACVSARLIWTAAELLAESDALTCRIHTLQNDALIAEIGDATIITDGLPTATATSSQVPVDAVGVTATITAGTLHRLVRRALILPTGLDRAPDEAAVVLVIEDSSVACTTDWGDPRTLRTTVRAGADTHGTAACEFVANGARDLLATSDPNEPVTIVIPDDDSSPLRLQGHRWNAQIARRPTPSQRFRDSLAQRIADAAGSRSRSLSETVCTVDLDGHPLRVELHDEGLPVLRCTTVLVRDVAASAELYEQLNDANAGLTGIRLWIVEDVIVAGVDVPTSQADDLPEIFLRFRRQLNGFDVFLSALGDGS